MKKLFLAITGLIFAGNVFAQSTIPVGSVCPDITITDTKGVQHKLYDYCNAGKYVLIDFYAYWCGPCAGVAPIIEEFYSKYGCNTGNVIVLGNESDPATTMSNLISFINMAGIDTNHSYPTNLGSNGGSTHANTYGVGAYPTVILVGPDKKMKNNDIWPIGSVANIEAAFPAGAITPKACATPASVGQVSNQIALSVTPNPARDYLQVIAENIEQISVFNALGARVLEVQPEPGNQGISLQGLADGFYMIQVKTTQGTAVRKFQKQ